MSSHKKDATIPAAHAADLEIVARNQITQQYLGGSVYHTARNKKYKIYFAYRAIAFVHY